MSGALEWLAAHALGAGIVPVTANPDPWRSAIVGPVSKRRLMLERIDAAGPTGCTASELGRAADCPSRKVWAILDADVQAGLLHVRRTTGGRMRWARGDAPTREIGRAIALLQRHGYKVTR